MVAIGTFNELKAVEIDAKGATFDASPLGQAFMPAKQLPKRFGLNDTLNVFLYFDAQDRLSATTKAPHAQVGECAYLRVADTNAYGAFLDWGLPKELFVPHSEQDPKMIADRSYLVRLYTDSENRILATSKLDKFVTSETTTLKQGQQVDMIIAAKTDLGYKAVVNNQFWGVLYDNEIFRPVWVGLKIKGYVKAERPDKKLDVTLAPPVAEKLDATGEKILQKLKAEQGFLPLTDKTDPVQIKNAFGVSKKVFKNSIGVLYKKRLITIEEDGIRLVD